MSTLDRPGGAPRHLVLIDFDWEDADLLPELLRMPGVSVRLVAGSSEQDAGVRVADLCGLPRSVELADLTREIFDVALLSERSARREQVERLFRALGTPVESPAPFVRNGDTHERRDIAVADGAAGGHDAVAPDGAPIGNGTWPDGDAPAGLAADSDREDRPALPDPDDTLGLERLLARWVNETQASAAVLYRVDGEQLVRACRSGPEDALLESLAQLAGRLDMPHVLTREDGPQQGRLWGAWPFRSPCRRAVLAVAAAEGRHGRRVWEVAVQSLCAAWSVAEHATGEERPRVNVLPPAAFEQRLQMAVERHQTEGFRFALHRLTFPPHEGAVEALLHDLPDRLRGTDCLCRPSPHELLLLCAGSARAFAHVRHRVHTLWKAAWSAVGGTGPAPEIHDERLELDTAHGAREFLHAAEEWLTPHPWS